MSLADVLLPLVIAATAAIYGIASGRARASRLRELQDDISQGNLRGYLTLAIVIILILVSFAFQA
jgi:hypothetical protein